MPTVKHWLRLLIFDTLAVAAMVTALLIGWLPGPGGIPLFLIGLGLFSVNHTWARRYIKLLRKYADHISDVIFIPRLYLFFDVLATVMILGGAWGFLAAENVWWQGAGIWSAVLGVVVAFGNRNRWAQFKRSLKRRTRA